MVEVKKKGVYLLKGKVLVEDADQCSIAEVNHHLAQAGLSPLIQDKIEQEKACTATMAYGILKSHNVANDMKNLQLRFDALTSHDITYVGIIQTALASGLKEFPVPYVLTNCHNSLCAVGGTINEDDHIFGYSAAKKFGGIFVPPHQAVIHQYMREMMAGCGKMILGSDSHTRYGALGTMAIGEGGPEIVKQLLKRTYEISRPEVIAIYLDGKPKLGVGPQDVALAIIRAVFKEGIVKNKVMEFVGPGISNLSVDFRNGIDVMTTETTCLSSIWCTDEQVEKYYKIHGRKEAYQKLEPGEVSYYDGLVKVNLSKIESMIALPFHPSNVWTVHELNDYGADILRQVELEGQQKIENPHLKLNLTEKLVNGRLKVDQGIVAGCAGGTFENIVAMTAILGKQSVGDFSLSVYPSSQPVFLELMNNGSIEQLTIAGASIRSAFCGPCFGAGDVPANNGLSIRHTTRNFINREGSKPVDGQLASVALMDARSIAATALNGGQLTAATDVEFTPSQQTYQFNKQIYDNRVYQGFGKANSDEKLIFGPNIISWPKVRALPENLLLKFASVIHDPVTTTDELIPSGETSSYRSNPLRLAEFTLSRKDPAYVGKAKAIQQLEVKRQLIAEGGAIDDLAKIFLPIIDEGQSEEQIKQLVTHTGLGSVIFAIKPGDGSAREQAASCQRVLGGDANIAVEYATKRYRSNLINWGMIPFTIASDDKEKINVDDLLYIPAIRQAIVSGKETVTAYIIHSDKKTAIELIMQNLSQDDRDILLSGCLINYYTD
ncbi:aconitate hydratase [Sporomusaceae bacterium BoRhaA]|uniref:hydratase n=1 Tax=Pelorhabdus rhamnosifermentans TaxID=2772457 RepID=UPI001C062B3D|nr:hydratase [Pelorhabdus rhamnosifermentans]MBU2703168.1 aconitate hydratase [Pelorhabdus rhamnosifermentans]